MKSVKEKQESCRKSIFALLLTELNWTEECELGEWIIS